MTASSTFVAFDGDGYELQMGRWSRQLAPFFIRFAGIDTGGSVLDVGCGTGALSSALAQEASITQIQGIDFSPAYVAHAAGHLNDPRAHFEVADACALPFADASFDHALSQLVLQFIPDPIQAIREMRRVTSPGGRVAAAVWDTRGGMTMMRLFWDTAAMLSDAGNLGRARALTRPMSRPGELSTAWNSAGLTDVAQSEITIRMRFASFADYWAPAEGRDGPLAAYVGTLAPDERGKLKDAVKRAYLDGDPDGERSFIATAWVVKGTVPSA